MSTSTTNELLEKQNEMITELIAITRDCVNACRLVLQSNQMNELRRDSKPLLTSREIAFRRPYRPSNPVAEKAMQTTKELWLNGRSRSEIAKELKIPYSTVCQFIRGYTGRYAIVARHKKRLIQSPLPPHANNP